MFQIFFPAAIEELLKLAIVLGFRKTEYKYRCIFVFAVIEGIIDMPFVFEHLNTYLGVNYYLSWILALIVLVSLKFFHVASSIIYLTSGNLISAVLFCTFWNGSVSLLVDILPTLKLFEYVFYSGCFLFFDIILVVLYLIADTKLPKMKKNKS